MERGDWLMTLSRRLALKISNGVVRHASPGCKDWAEGLAAEVAFIERDWAALGWALGSVKVLFDRREEPIRSLADVPAAARDYFGKRRLQIQQVYGLYFIFWIPLSVLVYTLFSVHRYPMDRVSALLIMGSMILFGFRMRAYGEREVDRPVNLYECIPNYRLELQRDIDYNGWATKVCFGGLILGIFLAFFGVHGTVQGTLYAMTPLVLTFFSPLMWMYMHRRKLQRRIDELDALLANVEGAS
jgi:hypothetical protein